MKTRILSAGLVLAVAATTLPLKAGARPAALDGTWKVELPCAGATGVYADRCAAGQRDDFTLAVARRGAKLCGWYEATAQLKNHVADGDLHDWAFRPSAPGIYKVHFNLSGAMGDAVVRVNGDMMTWKVLRKLSHKEDNPTTWTFWPPDSATLVRQPVSEVSNPPTCN